MPRESLPEARRVGVAGGGYRPGMSTST